MIYEEEEEEEVNTNPHPYIHANLLRENANKSYRRLSSATVFCVVVFVLYVLCFLFK